MKNKFSRFAFLLALLSACGLPVTTEPAIQRAQTPSPLVTLTPLLRPTSTIEDLRLVPGGSPFCQVSPQKARLGSSVNISAFRLPPNHRISVFVFYDEHGSIELPLSIVTDENGYINFDIRVPVELPTETWSSIALIPEGPLEGPFCRIWPWTESSLATWSAWQTEVRAPTLTPPPEQAAITATQQFLHDKLDKYCIYRNQARGFRFSPNGLWVEVFCSSGTIEIVRVDETKKWEVSSDTLISYGAEYFGGVNHWSNDGAYAYIGFNPHTDGYWEPFHQGIVLYRLDLETGQIGEVLPLVRSNWRYYSLAFSPNDRRLAYIVTDQSPVILNIRDMQTGVEQSFEFDPKYNTGGGFVWSPDSQKLIFSITQFDTSTYEYIATSIILWESHKPDTTTLINDHQEVLVPVEWIDGTKIMLQVLYDDDTKFEFDLVSNELKQISP